MSMMRLNLRDNALYSLYVAVEHLIAAESDDSADGRRNHDGEDGTISWVENGKLTYYAPVAPYPPNTYRYRFAL
jgi:hypothetical protein